MNVKQTSNEVTEPITLDEIKSYLRIDGNEEDTLIQSFISTAREQTEIFTGRSIAVKQYELYLDEFAETICIPLPPLKEVTSITYKDKDNVETVFNDYYVDTIAEPGLVHIDGIPSFEPHRVNPIKITFTAGYDTLPKVIKTAMYLLISHFYENRDIVVNQPVVKVPFTFESLLYPQRVRWF